jgi:glycosyltransferase involved in cell wall biosynthesis
MRAMRMLEDARPGRYRLEWVGAGRLAGAVQAQVEELGLGHAVTLAGNVPFGDDLLRRYREADMLVHVALTEGFPQVLVEAMAAGLPAVATDVGGVRAGMDDGALAALVPPSDARAIADAVMRLDDDAALRARLSAAGAARAATLTLDAEAARVAAFLAGAA